MKKLALLFLLSLAACPHPPPKPSAVDMAIPVADLNLCSINVEVLGPDVCEGYFTEEDWPCAICRGAFSCFDSDDEVYCTSGGCNDPKCKFVPGE